MNTKKYVAIRLLVLIIIGVILIPQNPINNYLNYTLGQAVFIIYYPLPFYVIYSLTKIAEKIIAEKKNKQGAKLKQHEKNEKMSYHMNTKKYVAIRLLVLIILGAILFVENPIIIYLDYILGFGTLIVYYAFPFYVIYSLAKIAKKL